METNVGESRRNGGHFSLQDDAQEYSIVRLNTNEENCTIQRNGRDLRKSPSMWAHTHKLLECRQFVTAAHPEKLIITPRINCQQRQRLRRPAYNRKSRPCASPPALRRWTSAPWSGSCAGSRRRRTPGRSQQQRRCPASR